MMSMIGRKTEKIIKDKLKGRYEKFI